MEYIKDFYQWEDLLKIVKKLRAPDGCPWDRAQTHESIRSCLIEECYEVLEAVENKDIGNLREELGDVMLQVLLHSEIASEENEFTLEEVINELSHKLVRRHPHVFGDEEKAKDALDGIGRWESVKKKEKQGGNGPESVPRSFPALIRAQKVQKKAVKENKEMLDKKQTVSVLRELLERIAENDPDPDKPLDEDNIMGQFLFEAVKLFEETDKNAENSLTKATEEYINIIVGQKTAQ